MSIIPEILTLIFALVAMLVMFVLAWAAWRHRNPPASGSDASLEDLKEFGPSATNQWLRGLRVFFLLLICTVLGFHSYWVFRADSSESFTRAKRLDARNRRLAESGLKGWILDRSGKLESALVRYRADAGVISREYPLGPAGVHLTGYSDYIFGSGGMEFAYRDWLTEPASIKNQILSSNPVGKDLKVSIDIGLQREAANLIANQGKGAAAVVLLLPNNEVLAMASAPTFEPGSINDEATWRRISEEAESAPSISPLVNRALGTLVTGGPAFYYRPGSTFKTFIAAVAIDTGITNETFVCKEEGFLPPASGRPIRDFGGHVHGALGLQDAFKLSCNQYFAQLGLKIGKERLENYARRLGYLTSPESNTRRDLNLWQVLHGDRDDYNSIFAPPPHRLDLSAKATAYDVALQSIGQGFCDQTVLGMALLASIAANPDGSVVSPTFEVNAPRNVVGPFISPQSAAQLRTLMRSVVEGGTASGAFAHLSGRVTSGGKTGTADREVTVYNSQGKPVVDRVDEKGRTYYKTQGWTDSWYIGYAPADNPVIAFAVVVENGGEGSKAAAPIAARLIEKAASLGYLGAAKQAPRNGGRNGAQPRPR